MNLLINIGFYRILPEPLLNILSSAPHNDSTG